jgi:hypothetical protein
MEEPIVRVVASKRHALTSVGPVFIYFSRCPPDLTTVRWFARHYREHQLAHPEGIGFVQYADPAPGARPGLEGEARRELIAALRVGEIGKAGIVVFTGTGFWAATFRAFVAGVLLMLRDVSGPAKIYPSLNDALPWFIEKLAAANIFVSHGDIRAEVQRLEAATRDAEPIR